MKQRQISATSMVFEEKPLDFSPKFEVVSCYIEYKGKILLVLRHPNKPQGDTWCIPGGKVEKNEELSEAVVREILEETQIDLSHIPFTYARQHFVRHHGYDFVYHTFHAITLKPLSVILDIVDNKDYKWVSPQEALTMNLLDDEDTCIKKYYGLL